MKVYIVRMYDEVWDCWENYAAFDTEEKAIKVCEEITKANTNSLVNLEELDVK